VCESASGQRKGLHVNQNEITVITSGRKEDEIKLRTEQIRRTLLRRATSMTENKEAGLGIL